LTELELSTEFRNNPFFCEACGTDRKRNAVYVLRHQITKVWSQVGRNCLSLFLGGVDPKNVIASLEMIQNFYALAEGSADPNFFGNAGRALWDLRGVLALTEFVIRKCGWLSRSKAREMWPIGESTSDIVSSILMCNNHSPQEIKDLKKDYKEEGANEVYVDEVIDWARELRSQSDLAEYLFNLTVVLNNEALNPKHLGLACSVFAAFGYANNKKQENKAGETSQYIGNIKDKIEFDTILVDQKVWPGFQGGVTTVYFFKDKDGNRLNWKSSNDLKLTINNKYHIVGTVKSHETYRNMKQTWITRAKVK
jgi:hypothetical protein